jgi:hypothetical protein
MPKANRPLRRLGNIPEKDCLACGRPFSWRRKWVRDWEAVKFCSDRCRANKPAASLPDA